MLQKHLLDDCQKEGTGSLFHKKNKNKSSTRGAHLVPMAIPTIYQCNFEPNLINTLNIMESVTNFLT